MLFTLFLFYTKNFKEKHSFFNFVLLYFTLQRNLPNLKQFLNLLKQNFLNNSLTRRQLIYLYFINILIIFNKNKKIHGDEVGVLG